MKRVTILVLACFLGLTSFVFAQGFPGMGNVVPNPEIRYPAGEELNIGDKDTVTIKWRTPGSFDIDHVNCKIYKSYITSDFNKIFEQDVDPFQSEVDVKTSLFQNGQKYTVVLQSISQEGYKSDKVFNSFVVVKK
jgi:hypothetical protein